MKLREDKIQEMLSGIQFRSLPARLLFKNLNIQILVGYVRTVCVRVVIVAQFEGRAKS
jgi:hypothetical protein